MDNFSSKNAEVENDHTENHMLKIGALLEEKCEYHGDTIGRYSEFIN